MRNILALVGAATLTFLGIGWYLGWYQISSHVPSPQGKQSVQVDINPDKITQDVKKGVEKGGEIVDQLREKKADPPAPEAAQRRTFSPRHRLGESGNGSSGGWRPIDGKRPAEGDGAIGSRSRETNCPNPQFQLRARGNSAGPFVS